MKFQKYFKPFIFSATNGNWDMYLCISKIYLLLNPWGMGPGHLLAWPAKGKFLRRAACHKHSSWNSLAHCFFTHDICTHSEMGTRIKISINRWSGSFAKGLSVQRNVILLCSSVIRLQENAENISKQKREIQTNH